MLRVQFEDTIWIENAHNDLRQLSKQSMYLKEYSAKFQVLVDWPESMKVDYFCNGLNAQILVTPPHLDWLDPAGSQSRGWQQLVKLICQNQQLVSRKADQHSKERGRPRDSGARERGQRFCQGCCLKCAGEGHFAAKCPSAPSTPPRTPTSDKTSPPTEHREEAPTQDSQVSTGGFPRRIQLRQTQRARHRCRRPAIGERVRPASGGAQGKVPDDNVPRRVRPTGSFSMGTHVWREGGGNLTFLVSK